MKTFKWGLLLSAIVISLAGGGLWLAQGEWLYPDQTRTDSLLNLDDNTVGQTFVATQGGLEGIDLKMALPNTLTGTLTLHLRTSPDALQDVQTTTIVVPDAVSAPGWVHFPLEPIPDSHAQYYYFFIEAGEEFSHEIAAIHYAPPATYADGAMYVNGQPQEGQLAFRLAYNRPLILYDLLQSMATSLIRAAAGVLAFTLPGWALLVLFQRNDKEKLIHHWSEGASVAAGLSMALYPILYMGADTLSWQPGSVLVWIVIITSALLLSAHYRFWRLHWRQLPGAFQTWATSTTIWADVTLLIVLAAAAGGRLLMVRGLEMPLWHDSVQHAVITQRIVETGGLFQSWLPYSPHTTFSFHFGYHLDTAVFGWVTGLDTPQAMLWGGQLFNLFAAFTLYALAYRIKGVWAGTVAVLVAGLFTLFPAYFTNWGRYPQMMGQAILPAAAWWTWVTLRYDGNRPYANLAWMLGGAGLIVGSVLSYYRMSFHYLAFVVAALLVHVQSRRELFAWPKWLTLAGTALAAALMMLPWTGSLLAQMVTSTAADTAITQPAVSLWEQIVTTSSTWTVPQLLLLLLGTLSILWWGRKAALPAIWFWMLIMLPVVRITSLPGTAIISDLTIHTSLYIPIALIWGVFAAYLLARLSPRWQWAILPLVIVAVAWQMPKIPRMLVHDWDLSSRPDMQAATWINENIPQDAFFLINGFEYKATPAASDAGWWLPLLTRRQTTIPPQYATFVEKPLIDDYREITTQLVVDLMAQSPTSAEGKVTICQFPYPITHVYVGQKRGMLRGTAPDVTPERPLLPAPSLLEDPAFELLYRRDRVLIFAFDRAVCAHE